jgi:flagellar P-ring protein precursor FlgI
MTPNIRFKSRLCRILRRVHGCLLALLLFGIASPARADKLRDLCDVVGARDNQLVGYGVVTGLNGTGDDITVPFAQQSLRALMRRLGIQVDAKQVRLKNVAAVIVTATIPAFVREGSRLDVTVSSMGNAKSLRGGVLIQTPLHGADRKTYAVAQGPLVVGGFSASGSSGSSVQENITTTGRVPTGALVEREIKTTYWLKETVTLALRSPDFGTAQRVVEALEKAFGKDAAHAVDGGSIEVKAPAEFKDKPVELLSKLGEVDVDPVTSARVVINERTGTIVAGGDVHLSPVAIAQGGITISIQENKQVVQPNALAAGQTQVVQNSAVDAQEKPGPTLTYVKGAATLADVAQSLSTLGVSPRELASILQALKGAGALRAEIVVQ